MGAERTSMRALKMFSSVFIRISGKEEKKLPLIFDEMYVSDISRVFMFE